MENPDPITMEQEKETETSDTTSVTDQTPSRNEFLTGLKLYLTLGSVTMVGFLISLDASIIVTVCLNQLYLFVLICKNQLLCRPSQESQHTFIRLQTLDGMVVLI
jgi:preprotein translocase subunit Sss1